MSELKTVAEFIVANCVVLERSLSTQSACNKLLVLIEALEAKLAEHEWVPLLDQLIKDEVNAVILVHSNQAFDGPSEKIYVEGNLTDHVSKSYSGETRLACFEKAVADLLPQTEEKS